MIELDIIKIFLDIFCSILLLLSIIDSDGLNINDDFIFYSIVYSI